MILPALNRYYARKAADPGARIAPRGFEWKGIDFVLLLDSSGKLIAIEDNREPQGKKRIARRHLVPQAVKKTSGVAANLLWDNAEYVLGLVKKGKPERTRAAHEAFIARIRDELGSLDDDGISAVLALLGHLDLTALDGRANCRPQLPHYPKISLGFDREGIPALPP
jgi:CRISPR-associated protein Csd1